MANQNLMVHFCVHFPSPQHHWLKCCLHHIYTWLSLTSAFSPCYSLSMASGQSPFHLQHFWWGSSEQEVDQQKVQMHLSGLVPGKFVPISSGHKFHILFISFRFLGLQVLFFSFVQFIRFCFSRYALCIFKLYVQELSWSFKLNSQWESKQKVLRIV